MYCIETSLENQSFFNSLVEEYPENFIIMKKNNFILDGDNLQVFIALSPIVITGVCQVIVALINAQKEFSFKDFEVVGNNIFAKAGKDIVEEKWIDFMKRNFKQEYTTARLEHLSAKKAGIER